MGRLGRRAAPLLLLAGALGATPAGLEKPVSLGTSEAELRTRFGEALREVSVARAPSLQEQVLELARAQSAAQGVPEDGAAEPDPGEAAKAEPERAAEPAQPFRDQRRLARTLAEGDVRGVEYDVFRGRVYRIRWRLAERFERPLMGALVEHLRERLGPPGYDQTLEARPGSVEASLRRTGWRREGRALEVRQLHPFGGGPLFVSLADVAALQSIIDAQGVVLPQPESSGEWWRRPQKPPALLTEAERERLLAGVDALMGAVGF